MSPAVNELRSTLTVLLLLVLCAGADHAWSATRADPRVLQSPQADTLVGSGSGVIVRGRLWRSSFSTWSLGQKLTFAQWEVEITIENWTRNPVALGDSLIVLEQAHAPEESVAFSVTRERAPESQRTSRFAGRYAITFASHVPPNGDGRWPFVDMDYWLLNSLYFNYPPLKSFPDGGYPTVAPATRLTIRETIPTLRTVADYWEYVVLVAPLIRSADGSLQQPIFRFDVPATFDPGGQWLLLDNELFTLRADEMRRIITDTNAPLWRRRYALNWLVDYFADEARDETVRLAADSGTPTLLRYTAILNLGQLKDRAMVPKLLDILAGANTTQEKVPALAALGWSGDRLAAPAVRAQLSSSDPIVRQQAIESLRDLADPEAVQPILAVIRSKTDRSLYRSATQALAAIGTVDAVDALSNIASESKGDLRLRQDAISALGTAARASTMPLLIALATQPKEKADLRSSATSALGRFSQTEAVDALVRVADEKNPALAREALWALLEPHEAQRDRRVIEMAARADYPHRVLVTRLLAANWVQDFVPTLRNMLDQPLDSELKLTAFQAMATLDRSSITAAEFTDVWRLFKNSHNDKDLSISIANGLKSAGFSDRSVIPELINDVDKRTNKSYYASVIVLEHLSGKSLGLTGFWESAKTVDEAREAWRTWFAEQRMP